MNVDIRDIELDTIMHKGSLLSISSIAMRKGIVYSPCTSRDEIIDHLFEAIPMLSDTHF